MLLQLLTCTAQVHFAGWKSADDEWIERQSKRLRLCNQRIPPVLRKRKSHDEPRAADTWTLCRSATHTVEEQECAADPRCRVKCYYLVGKLFLQCLVMENQLQPQQRLHTFMMKSLWCTRPSWKTSLPECLSGMDEWDADLAKQWGEMLCGQVWLPTHERDTDACGEVVAQAPKGGVGAGRPAGVVGYAVVGYAAAVGNVLQRRTPPTFG